MGGVCLPRQQRSDIYLAFHPPSRASDAHASSTAGRHKHSMDTTPRLPASRLEEALRSRQFAMTPEITPPVSCNAEDVLGHTLPLRGVVAPHNATCVPSP